MKRRQKQFVLHTPNGDCAVLCVKPWVYVQNTEEKINTCVWLVCFAVSKSKRQLNDWLNQRKNKRSRTLSKKMTGKSGPGPLMWAFKNLKHIEEYIPNWDSLWFWFDAVEKDKQRRVYLKWFARYGNPTWEYLTDKDAFYFFKNPALK